MLGKINIKFDASWSLYIKYRDAKSKGIDYKLDGLL